MILMVEMDSALSKTSKALKILKFDSYKVNLQKFLSNFPYKIFHDFQSEKTII